MASPSFVLPWFPSRSLNCSLSYFFKLQCVVALLKLWILSSRPSSRADVPDHLIILLVINFCSFVYQMTLWSYRVVALSHFLKCSFGIGAYVVQLDSSRVELLFSLLILSSQPLDCLDVVGSGLHPLVWNWYSLMFSIRAFGIVFAILLAQ